MIAIENLEYSYDDLILSGITLDITEGERVAVLGENGAGKTTFLKLLAGLLEPTGGTITRNGAVGFAPEDPQAALFAETVTDEVSFYPKNRGLDPRDHAETAMRQMGVYALRDRNPTELSTGEQRRVSIAAVLAGNPDVITLDEPTAGLDRTGERYLGTVLTEIEQTVVFCTHASEFAYDIADRVLVFTAGSIRTEGSPRDVLSNDSVLADAGIQVPEQIAWARDQGFDKPPTSFDEAVQLFTDLHT